MELLDIKLPSFTRMQYANLECQNVWGQKIENTKELYQKLEYLTVLHDIRDCMIGHLVNPHQLIDYQRFFSKIGLYVIPITKEASGNGAGFSHHSSGYNGQGDFSYRVVITKSLEKADEFINAHYNHDDITIGRLLGFPKCCSEFFDKNWKLGYFDPIWQQAINSSDKVVKNRRQLDGNEFIRISNQSYKETLSVMRYIGVRVLSHFSCSFDCDESKEVANKWIQVARDERLNGLEETLEIMNLPFEWNCFKGAAVVNTPVFKIVSSSMACYPAHVIQVESDFYPKEAPTGIQFPWKLKTKC